MYCTNCGRQMPDGAKFCTGCGEPLTGAAAVPRPESKEPEEPRPKHECAAAPASPEEGKKSRAPLILGLTALVLVLAAAGWYFLRGRTGGEEAADAQETAAALPVAAAEEEEEQAIPEMTAEQIAEAPWGSAVTDFLSCLRGRDTEGAAALVPDQFYAAAATQAGMDEATCRSTLLDALGRVTARVPVQGALLDVAEEDKDACPTLSEEPKECWSMTLRLTMASGGRYEMPLWAVSWDGTSWSIVWDAWLDSAVMNSISTQGEPTAPMLSLQDYYLVEVHGSAGEGMNWDSPDPYYLTTCEYDSRMHLVREHVTGQDGTDYETRYFPDLRGNVLAEQLSGTNGPASYALLHGYDSEGRVLWDMRCDGSMRWTDVEYTIYEYDESGRHTGAHRYHVDSIDPWTGELTGQTALADTAYIYEDNVCNVEETDLATGCKNVRRYILPEDIIFFYGEYDANGELTYTETYDNAGNLLDMSRFENGTAGGPETFVQCSNTYDDYGNLTRVETDIYEWYSHEVTDYIYVTAEELAATVGAVWPPLTESTVPDQEETSPGDSGEVLVPGEGYTFPAWVDMNDLSLLQSWWSQNMGDWDTQGALGDFDRDGHIDLVYVDTRDPGGEAGAIEGCLLRVVNGSVQKLTVHRGGESHIQGFFSLFTRVDPSTGTGTLIRNDGITFRGHGTVGLVSYHIGSGGEQVEDGRISITSELGDERTEEEWESFSMQEADYLQGAICLHNEVLEADGYAIYQYSLTVLQLLGLY